MVFLRSHPVLLESLLQPLGVKTQRLPGKCEGCPDLNPDESKPLGWKGPCSKYQKNERLCGQIDLNLLDLVPGKSISELVVLNNQIGSNLLRVNLEPPQPPTGAADLVRWVKAAHAEVFEPIPSIAGKFRCSYVRFGGAGIHRRSGYPSEEVNEAMLRLFDHYQHLSKEYSDGPFLAMAGVLQRIFEIHPFMDGNGRIGRLLIASIAWQKGWQLHHDRDGENTRYLDAIAYAHRALARESAARNPFYTPPKEKQALAPLAECLKKVWVVRDEEVEEEPPSEDG